MFALLLAKDPDERAVLTLVLQRAGLAVTPVGDFEKTIQTWAERPVDLILLALQSADPLVQVQRIRRETDVPLVVLIDQTGEDVHCTLLEAGADLVIARPFSARVLIAQIRALLRRAGSMPLFSLPTLSLAGLTLDPTTRTVEVAGQPSRRLTHLEFRLLYILMTHKGQVLPAETIVERVWGYTGRGDRALLRGLISRLRAKVEPDPRSPRYILTVPGIGYSFNPQEG